VALLLCMAVQTLGAADYTASLFGIRSDGTTMNTRSIQKAIDFIHEKGGGRLVFYVGRYLTGSIELKSNVEIVLQEGAVLVASVNPYDYDVFAGWSALIGAVGAEHIGITGKGVVDGRGRELAYNIIAQVHGGVLADGLGYDRPARGVILYFHSCRNVRMEGCLYKDAANRVINFEQCRELTLHGVTVKSSHYWNNDALGILDCDGVLITDSYFEGSDDAICFKTHDPKLACQNVVVRNCVARSSANGIKFGTGSVGGFRNIRLSNITVYDTFRSAFTVQAVDGGFAEDISVDSLRVYHTGNAIYLRVGDRGSAASERKSYMKNISVTNVYAEITDEKPDAGYVYEGPVEDLPRNLSPCSIVGLKGNDITGVHLQNVEIVISAGGNPHYAKVGLSARELDAIPEMPAAYPEFSQFKELPAWGFYIRHARDIHFDGVKLTALKRDYRPAIVLDDVKDADFRLTEFQEPGGRKKQIHAHRSTGILHNR
jgi:hypothetical protein